MATPPPLSFTENPLYGRLRYKLRPLTNWLLCLAILAVVAFFLVQSIAAPLLWLVEFGVIALLAYFNFMVLDKRVITIHCPDCRKQLRSNTPWICGECNRKNQRADDFPFLDRCEHCSAESKCYQCHHCGKPIFFTEDLRSENCASSTLPVVEPDQSDKQTKKRQTLEHKIQMEELAAKLAMTKQWRESAKEKTPAEEVEESFNKHFSRHMGARDFARKQKAANKEKYHDDPEALQDANDTVDDWLRSRT